HRAQPPGDGASMPRRAESYEERSERRQEARERRRGRVNATCCRASVTPGRGTAASPRQAEFLRRRNLGPEAGEALPGQRRTRSPKDSHSPAWGGPSPRCPRVSTGTQTLPGSAPTDPKDLEPKQGQPWAGGSGLGALGWGSGLCPSSGPTDHVPVPQEALHRELLLKQKMVILQELLSTLLQASEKSWQGQLNEDKLRCKLRVLENQLQACSQSYSKECVKKILIEMEDQKQTYEQKAKEALQKMLEEKLLTEQQLQNSQSPSLCLQCSELRSELEALSQEYQWCLTRLRQCRDELNRSQGSQAQVGAPALTPVLHTGLGHIPCSVPCPLLCALHTGLGHVPSSVPCRGHVC
uniref:TRAF3 interacting protein 3 n=1 Tax=Junco hyemalis TaxID=40217 RepID=A0A8C5JRB5_JUNHY